MSERHETYELASKAARADGWRWNVETGYYERDGRLGFISQGALPGGGWRMFLVPRRRRSNYA